MVGPDTWGQLVEAGYQLGDRTLYLHSPFHRGDDVSALQRKLNGLGFDAGREDGLFGPLTDRAVREFQRNVGEEPDGIVGIDTLVHARADASHGIGTGSGGRARGRVGPFDAVLDRRTGRRDRRGDRRKGPRSSRSRSALADELAALGAKPVVLEASGGTGSSGLARAANELSASRVHLAAGRVRGSARGHVRVRVLRQRHDAFARWQAPRGAGRRGARARARLPRAPGGARRTRSCARRGCRRCRSNRA